MCQTEAQFMAIQAELYERVCRLTVIEQEKVCCVIWL